MISSRAHSTICEMTCRRDLQIKRAENHTKSPHQMVSLSWTMANKFMRGVEFHSGELQQMSYRKKLKSVSIAPRLL